MCFVWISEQTAIISLYSINWLVSDGRLPTPLKQHTYCGLQCHFVGELNLFDVTKTTQIIVTASSRPPCGLNALTDRNDVDPNPNSELLTVTYPCACGPAQASYSTANLDNAGHATVPFLTSALDGNYCPASRFDRLTPRSLGIS